MAPAARKGPSTFASAMKKDGSASAVPKAKAKAQAKGLQWTKDGDGDTGGGSSGAPFQPPPRQSTTLADKVQTEALSSSQSAPSLQKNGSLFQRGLTTDSMAESHNGGADSPTAERPLARSRSRGGVQSSRTAESFDEPPSAAPSAAPFVPAAADDDPPDPFFQNRQPGPPPAEGEARPDFPQRRGRGTPGVHELQLKEGSGKQRVHTRSELTAMGVGDASNKYNRRKTLTTADILALAGMSADKRSLFGTGQRIDIKAWGNLIENYKHGGHFEHVVGTLGQRKKREQAEKKELDQYLLARLQGIQLDPTVSADDKALAEKVLKTAFTDRSLRLRDGLGGLAVLKHEGITEADNWGHKVGCSCSTCKPPNLAAAGAPTARMAQNDLPSYELCEDPTAPLKKKTGKAMCSEISLNFSSDAVHAAIHKYDPYTKGDEDLEKSFSRSFGRKIRQNESRVIDAPAGSCAGNFNKDQVRGKSVSSKSEQQDVRTDAGMAVAPREDDPPQTTTRITSCKKADGQFHGNYSQETERLAIHWNQPLYRFDHFAAASPDAYRSLRRSNPPQSIANLGSRNILTAQCPAEDDMDLSRKQLNYTGKRNCSDAVKHVTDHDKVATEETNHRNHRMSEDRHFAARCHDTVVVKQAVNDQVKDIRDRNRHTQSTNMAASLRWE